MRERVFREAGGEEQAAMSEVIHAIVSVGVAGAFLWRAARASRPPRAPTLAAAAPTWTARATCLGPSAAGDAPAGEPPASFTSSRFGRCRCPCSVRTSARGALDP
jgi:hypothetical protein